MSTPPLDIDPDTTPLHALAGQGDVAALRRRLDAGEDPDAVRNGATALGWAVSKGHVAAAELLLDRGARLVAPGVEPQLYTCVASCPTLLSRLLAVGGEPNATFGPLGTALHAAALKGNREAVELLIAAGADVNALSAQGHTPLALAATHGFLEIVQRLIGCGASVHARTGKEQLTPFELALVGRHQAVVDCLRAAAGLPPRPGRELLADAVLAAVRAGDVARVDLWLGHDASVDGRDARGRTPLHLAVAADNERLVSRLVEAGADVDAVDADGKAPRDLVAAPSPPGDRFAVAKHARLVACLAQPRRLKPEVALLRRWLRGDSPVEEVAQALDLLEAKSWLVGALTFAELRRLGERGGARGEQVASRRSFASQGPSLGPCPSCGRSTVDNAVCSVRHGNPATPASDTEVSWSGTCSSCGTEVTE